MTFRRRITLAAAAAVAVAVVLASLLTYLLASHQMHKQVDEQLRSRADGLRFVATPGTGQTRDERYLGEILRASPATHAGTTGPGTSGPSATGPLTLPHANPLGNLSPHPDQVRGYQQLVGSGGKVLFKSSPGVTLPVEARTLRLVASGGQPFYRSAHVAGAHLRILAEPLRRGFALQLAQPLTSVDRLLRRLRIVLAVLDLGGIALAALLGRLVAGAAVAPLRRLTQASEHVRRTQDLSERIDPAGEDEIGRLAHSFNAMLDALQNSMAALDASVHAQRQLVADASHELRTPVTSVRTNIEVLRQQPDMPVAERRRMLDDVIRQTEELTALMNDLIELARGEQPAGEREDVRLDQVVAEAVERASRHSPSTRFATHLDPVVLSGSSGRLARAVNNLIDNAVAYSPPGGPVEVTLTGTGELRALPSARATGGSGNGNGAVSDQPAVAAALSVRDHGPGIAAQDLPHVFDRFYRGAEARGRPGSGLGLAIVRQVAEQHGGSVRAERAPDGGTVMRLELPGAEAVGEEVESPGLLQRV